MLPLNPSQGLPTPGRSEASTQPVSLRGEHLMVTSLEPVGWVGGWSPQTCKRSPRRKYSSPGSLGLPRGRSGYKSNATSPRRSRSGRSSAPTRPGRLGDRPQGGAKLTRPTWSCTPHNPFEKAATYGKERAALRLNPKRWTTTPGEGATLPLDPICLKWEHLPVTSFGPVWGGVPDFAEVSATVYTAMGG